MGGVDEDEEVTSWFLRSSSCARRCCSADIVNVSGRLGRAIATMFKPDEMSAQPARIVRAVRRKGKGEAVRTWTCAEVRDRDDVKTRMEGDRRERCDGATKRRGLGEGRGDGELEMGSWSRIAGKVVRGIPAASWRPR